MRIIKISRLRVSKPVLRQAVLALRTGQVVVFPTETAYGLAADPGNARAVRKIFAIKGRSPEKQLPLVAGSAAQAAALVQLSGRALALARRHWPGPLTIVAPRRRGRAAGVGGRTAAVRVPALAWARALALEFGGPITSTSANLSGRPIIHDPREVVRSFARRRARPDLFLDAGRLPPRRPSTIVRLGRRGRIEVLRPGPVRVE